MSRCLQKIIMQNKLKDFDDAKLLPSSVDLESLNLIFYELEIGYRTISIYHHH